MTERYLYASTFIGIDYSDERGYLAVEVSPPSLAPKRFATNDPVADYKAAIEYARTLDKPLLLLSSTTHFVFDVPGYRFDKHDNLVRSLKE